MRSNCRSVTVLFLITLCCCAHVSATDDRVAAWREDLRELATQIPQRHVNPFTKITREHFEQAVAELDDKIPGLSDVQIQVELMRLVARIGGAHTNVAVQDFRPPWGSYPIAIVKLKDGFFVNVAAESNARLLGAKLVKVGDVGIDEAVRRVASAVPAENDAAMYQNVCAWLFRPELLQGLEIVKDPATVRVEVESTDGTRFSADVARNDRASPAPLRVMPDESLLKMPELQRPRERFYWFEHLPEHKAIYVRYDRCANDPRQMVLAFAAELMKAVDRDDVERVVIDLRRNGGGNSLIFRPVIEGLKERPKVNHQGGILVLIGPRTFSSAMMNAWDLRVTTDAILVGRPTGQKPNHFGEVRSFKLPRSGVSVYYSTKRFTMIGDNDPPSLMPDVPVEPTSAEYFSGRDVTVERALAYPKE